MRDRELLELAAKAAGFVYLTSGKTFNPVELNFTWKPLIDDGDAMRLVVKLGLISELQTMIEMYVEESDFNRDPYAATRRAIVRAAAEIGRTMA